MPTSASSSYVNVKSSVDNEVSQTSLQVQLSAKVEARFAEHEFDDANIERVMLQKSVPYVEG